MSVGVLIVLSPLFIKNIVFTNNPVYPFLHKIIPSKNLYPQKIGILRNEWKEYGNRTFSQYMKQPWMLTFAHATSGSFIGVVFLFLLPGIIILIWKERRGPPVFKILVFSIIAATLIWSSQTKMMRYYISTMPMLCILIAVVLSKSTGVFQRV